MAGVELYDRATLVPAICEQLAQGVPMTVACKAVGMKVRTVNLWRENDPEIAAQFDEARDMGYDVIADRLRSTARGQGDSTQDVQRDKLIIDTDIKLLAKWDPRRYGDKVQLADADGNKLTAAQMSEAQLLAIAAQGIKADTDG